MNANTDDWAPVVPDKDGVPLLPTPKESKQPTTEEVVVDLFQRCMVESRKAHEEKYDSDKAERTAAMFLEARMQLSKFIEDIELRARQSKTEIDRVEADRYFHYKDSGIDKKTTEQALKQFVARDEEVVTAKREAAQAESELKKWTYIMDSLKDGHVYFRTLGKGKNDFS